MKIKLKYIIIGITILSVVLIIGILLITSSDQKLQIKNYGKHSASISIITVMEDSENNMNLSYTFDGETTLIVSRIEGTDQYDKIYHDGEDLIFLEETTKNVYKTSSVYTKLYTYFTNYLDLNKIETFKDTTRYSMSISKSAEIYTESTENGDIIYAVPYTDKTLEESEILKYSIIAL